MDIQWSLVIFTTLAGAGAWLAGCIGLNELLSKAKETSTKLIAAIVSLVLVVAGGLVSVTHLSHPDRIMAALGHPTSGIFMEALFVGLLSLALIVFIVMLKRQVNTKVVGIIVGIIGLVMTFVLGYSYMMYSRPAWNTILLPLTYMFTATPLGIGIWVALCAAKSESAATSFAATLLAIAGALSAVVAALYSVVSGAGMGVCALLLWGLTVFAGGVLPAVCGFMAMKKPEQGVMLGSIAAILAVVGCIGFRCAMWMVGIGIENFFGLV